VASAGGDLAEVDRNDSVAIYSSGTLARSARISNAFLVAQARHGLDRTLAELNLESPEFRTEVPQFLDGLVSHYVFDDGHLVVAHATQSVMEGPPVK
jgi:hypothetical protein